MPTTNHGIGRARAAEVRGGMIANLTFEDGAIIAANGGTIALTVASFPIVYRAKTVFAKLKSVQAGASTVKINSGQTITIAAGSLFGSYSNATRFDADDIQVDDYSKFEYVKIFSTVLDAATLLSYQNGTIWDYDQHCILWMDGKLKHYDPTNLRHIDVSKAGNNLTFGDGTTAGTFPTKLIMCGGGYNFLNQYLEKSYVNTLNTGTLITHFKATSIASAGIIGVCNSSTQRREITMFSNGLALCVYGDNKFRFGTNVMRANENYNLALSFDGANTPTLYRNGVPESLGAENSVGVGTASKIRIGMYGSTGGFFPGNIYKGAIYSIVLNQLQVIDAYLRMLQDQEV